MSLEVAVGCQAAWLKGRLDELQPHESELVFIDTLGHSAARAQCRRDSAPSRKSH